MQSHMNDLFVQGNPLVNVDSSYLRKSLSHIFYFLSNCFILSVSIKFSSSDALFLFCCLFLPQKMENCKKLSLFLTQSLVPFLPMVVWRNLFIAIAFPSSWFSSVYFTLNMKNKLFYFSILFSISFKLFPSLFLR